MHLVHSTKGVKVISHFYCSCGCKSPHTRWPLEFMLFVFISIVVFILSVMGYANLFDDENKIGLFYHVLSQSYNNHEYNIHMKVFQYIR